MPCAHEGETVLLVEGSTDCHVILALCKKFSVPETFGVHSCGSDDQAIRRLNALINAAQPSRIIGLVVDADDADIGQRWAKIRGKLSTYTYTIPHVPSQGGTIIEAIDNLPRLGFWIMPNNQDKGMIEDFCSEMIAPEAVTTIEQCISLAKGRGHTSYKDVHHSKALVHTYLSLQDEPGRPLGQAITATILRADTQTARQFVAWLTELFA
jgi:hypothetical protein